MKRFVAALLLALVAVPSRAAAQADACPAANWIFDIVETRPAPAPPLKRGLAVPVDKLGNFILNEHALEFDAATSSLASFTLVRQSDPQQRIPLASINSVKAGPLDFLIVHIPDAVGKVHYAPSFRVVDSFEKLRVVSSQSKRVVVAASKREIVVPGRDGGVRSLACPTTIEIINIPSYIRGDSGSPIIDDACNLVGITSKFAAGKDLFRNADNFARIMQEVAKQKDAAADAAGGAGVDELMLVLGRYEQFSALLERTGDVSVVSGYCMLASHIAMGGAVDLYQPKGGYSRAMFARRDRDFDATLAEMTKLTDIVPFVSDAVRAVSNGSRPEMQFAIASLLKLAHARGISLDTVDDFIAGPEAAVRTPVSPAAAGATPAPAAPSAPSGDGAATRGPDPGAPDAAAGSGAAPTGGTVAAPQGASAAGSALIKHTGTVSDAVVAAEGQVSKVPAEIPRLLLRLSPGERVTLAAEMAEMAQAVLARAESIEQVGAARRLADGSVAVAAHVAGMQESAEARLGTNAAAYATIAKALSFYSQASALVAVGGAADGATALAAAREQAKSLVEANETLNIAVAEVSARALRLDWQNPQAWTSFAQSSSNLGDHFGALKAASISAKSCRPGTACPAAAIAEAARAQAPALPDAATVGSLGAAAASPWEVEVLSPAEITRAPAISIDQKKAVEALLKDGAFGPNAIGVWSKAGACPSCLPAPRQLTSIDAVIGKRGIRF
ncbi:MAG TPA: hypothetical protein VGN82_10820 [Bosea sp. (in: a-proteobacteria)]|jgi:hypothetical protein|uniref:hypothetical protein n=1 Tax=Bosea sp. (in: a-proteobacteria) TaxID=1871050 RepID=UPI002E10843E|nr:hypothetical protein [Bosea sp. (in: a-proteobacteria)]